MTPQQVDPGTRDYFKTKTVKGYEYAATAFFNFSSDASDWLLQQKKTDKKLRGWIFSYHYQDSRLKSLYVVYTRRVK